MHDLPVLIGLCYLMLGPENSGLAAPQKPEPPNPAQTLTVLPSSPLTAVTPELLAKSARLDNFPPPPKEVLTEYLTGQHTCPAEQALIGVEVINRLNGGVSERRRFNGLLLRCDGFILVPLRLVSRGMSGNREADDQTIRVTLRPGTEQAKLAESFLNRFTSKYIELVVLRL
jgi:hypothetical protein